jgi:4'-phosphopantetheinyl transferase
MAAIWLGPFAGGAPGRHAALRAFCATTLGLAPTRLALAHDALDAPLLLLDGAPGPWRISSSSRENIALFGLSDDRIGVDVELFAEDEPAWNVLHSKEEAALRALPEDYRAEAFLGLWTVKEAYLKALGLGLRREPAELCVEMRGETFEIADAGRKTNLREARLWRGEAGGRTALCALVTLPAR